MSTTTTTSDKHDGRDAQPHYLTPVTFDSGVRFARGGRLGVTIKRTKVRLGPLTHAFWTVLFLLAAAVGPEYLFQTDVYAVGWMLAMTFIAGYVANTALVAFRADTVVPDEDGGWVEEGDDE